MSGKDQPQLATGDDAATEALASLLDAIGERFGSGVCAILMYGSCLRSGDLFDGLVDLYVVLEGYRSYRKPLLRWGNRFLPPNVFFLEVEVGARKARCKYSVIDVDQLEKAVSPAHFESYFWGRFCQPVAIVFEASATDRARLNQILMQARNTFLRQTLDLIPPAGSGDDLWARALAVSYSTELRAEGPSRAREIVANNRDFYQGVLTEWVRQNPGLVSYDETGNRYQLQVQQRRRMASIQWSLRRLWGKLLSLARLLKGFFTFDGGIDYIAWKLERHSGQTVEVPDAVRKRPLLRVWGFAWKLYRRGIFR